MLKRLMWKFPFGLRLKLARLVDEAGFIPQNHRWSMTLLKDFCMRDPDAYHRFMWKHHLGYSRAYEKANRFQDGHLLRLRRIQIQELKRLLGPRAQSVRSVLDVGCGIGHCLRFLEQHVFPNATQLQGIDIDPTSVRIGNRHLQRLGSKAVLHEDDILNLPDTHPARPWDVILCLGVLMYLNKDHASDLAGWMLRHARMMVVISSEAALDIDNSFLTESYQRSDGAWVHNLDAMMKGGRIVSRFCEMDRLVDGYTNYTLYARPHPANDRAARVSRREIMTD